MDYENVKKLGAVLTEVSMPHRYWTAKFSVSGADNPEPALEAGFDWFSALVDRLADTEIIGPPVPPRPQATAAQITAALESEPKPEPVRIPDGDGTADIRAVHGPLAIAHVASDKGTHYCKVYAGPYVKYGISVWPEALGAANIKGWADWPIGEKRALPAEMTAFVQFDGKKPIKVVELR